MMGLIRAFIITIILFSGVIVMISSFYGEIGTNYDVNSTSLGFLNRSQQINDVVNAMQNRTAETPGADETTLFIAFGVIDVAKLAGSSIDVATGISGDITNPENTDTVIPVPAAASVIVIGVILTLFVIGAASVWGRFRF